MGRIAAALLIATLVASAANPPMGKAQNESAEVAAMFLDVVALKQATGSDFNNAYTVIEVTVTPKGSAPLELQPDDFLLRINSSSDSSGPVAASQVYGAGGGLMLHQGKDTIGITATNPAYTGATPVASSSSASPETIKALQSKMLPAKTITGPVTGLLFFPIPKKRPRDLDLVYSTLTGKLHIAFR